MDFCVKKTTAEKQEILFDSAAETPLELELVLADFCSDIRKILKCVCECGISSVTRTGERITADGESVIRVLYVNDKGKIDCCQETVPFSKYVEIPLLPDNICSAAFAKCEYINCRATGQRKLSVSGKISVSFTVSHKGTQEIVSSAEGGGVQTKKESFSFRKCSAFANKCFDMNETVSLNDGEPSVGGLLYCASDAVLESVKAVNSKLLIKGTLLCELFYFSDGEERSIFKKTHTMPISQIMEPEGIGENSECSVILKPCCFSVQPQTDSSGSNRLLEISCRLNADVICTDQCTCDIITDCFPTDVEVEAEYSSAEFTVERNVFREVKSVRSVAEAQMNAESVIYACWSKEISAVCSCSQESYDCSACAVICVLYSDADGSCAYLEKPVDIKVMGELVPHEGSAVCRARARVKELSCAKTADHKIEISVSAEIVSEIEYTRQVRLCTAMKLNDEKKTERKSVLTVRYCEAGESLWDLAATYKTPLEVIKQENELDTDVTKERCVLLIP